MPNCENPVSSHVTKSTAPETRRFESTLRTASSKDSKDEACEHRFLRRDVELGVFGEVSLPLQDRERVTAGMPLAFHLGDVVRVDTGPFIVKRFRSGDDPDLVVPFELPIGPSDHVYLGPEAGLTLPNFGNTDGFVGFFAGYTLKSRSRALGDLGGRFRLPSTRTGFDVFQLMFELRFYFGL